MYVLTVKEPWATAIVLGWKPLENRTWASPKKIHAGRILIHSSAKAEPWNSPSWRIIAGIVKAELGDGYTGFETFRAFCLATQPGAILGAVTVAGQISQGQQALTTFKPNYKTPSVVMPWVDSPIKYVCGKVEQLKPVAVGSSNEEAEILRAWSESFVNETALNLNAQTPLALANLIWGDWHQNKWVLTDPVAIPGVPAKGRLGIWEHDCPGCYASDRGWINLPNGSCKDWGVMGSLRLPCGVCNTSRLTRLEQAQLETIEGIAKPKKLVVKNERLATWR